MSNYSGDILLDFTGLSMVAPEAVLYDNGAMVKRWLAVLIIGIGIFLIILAFSFPLYQHRINRINPAPLPNQLAGLSLFHETSGQTALAELVWLHGQEFQLNQGAVGSYGAHNEITLYIAGTPFVFMAGRMINDMRDKITGSDTPFTPIAEMDNGKRSVYQLSGLGQEHYYFKSGNLVIWLAVDEDLAEAALSQALDYYP